MKSYIKLSCGTKCYVDTDLVKELEKYNWHQNPNGYVWSKIKAKTVYIHRFITKCPKGLTVDHINRDKLLNTRDNLRIATYSQNNFNKEKKGIRYIPTHSKYRVEFNIKGKLYYFGEYYTKEKALYVYNTEASILHGEYAVMLPLNISIQEVDHLEELAHKEHIRSLGKASKHRYVTKLRNKWIVQKWSKLLNKTIRYGTFNTEDEAYRCALQNKLYS